MAYIQQPISRHLSGDTTMAGKTTMTPMASMAFAEIPKMEQYDLDRQYYLRHHALGPRAIQAAIGNRGDSDNANFFQVPTKSHHVSVNNPRTFGTPNIKRSMMENIHNAVSVDRMVLHKHGRDLASLPLVGGAMRTREQDYKRKEECARRAKLMGECRTYRGNEKLQKRVIGSEGKGWKCKGKRCFVGKGGAIRLGGDPSTYTPR